MCESVREREREREKEREREGWGREKRVREGSELMCKRGRERE